MLILAALTSLAGCQSPRALTTLEPASRPAAGIALENELTEDSTHGISLASHPAGESAPDPAGKSSDVNAHEISSGGDEGEGADGVARLSQPALAANRVAPAGSTVRPHITPVADHRAISFSQASEPRLPVDDDGQPLHDPSISWMTGDAADHYPDEYLIDGGDRDYPVHYDPYHRHGLDTEDAVAEFIDSDGKSRTQATNRITIYAPRFGSVRTVSTPSGDMQIARLSGVQDRVVDSGLGTRRGPDDYTRNDKLAGVRVRSRAGGVETREWERGVFNASRTIAHTKLQGLRQDRSYWLRGSLEQGNEARLAYGLDAARHWTRNENPVVMAEMESAGQVEAKFSMSEMTGTEPEGKEPGRLKIVKLADRKTAQPGDTVTFVIRYDNLGERPLHHLRIVDNLTPRLEYIEDSATSDRAGDIIVEENDEGSLVLTFKLDEALPAKTGGVITFQCKVR